MDDREVIARAIAESESRAGFLSLWEYSASFRDVFLQHADAVLAAYHAHLEASGRVIVPVEPTEAMVEAVDELEPLDTWWPDEPGPRNTPVQIYRAMIAAAKEPTDGR